MQQEPYEKAEVYAHPLPASAEVADTSLSVNIWKGIELPLLFMGVPLIYYFDFIAAYKAVPLLLIFAAVSIKLYRDKRLSKSLFRLGHYTGWGWMLLRFGIFAISCGAAVAYFLPNNLFDLPLYNTDRWLLTMLLYPLLSVLPQEFIFRVYFFRRYRSLLTNNHLMIVTNALLFSFAHIMFGNWVALACTFVGSFLFSRTYIKSRSILIASVEHALYGNFLFSIGLAEYFTLV
jgi:hypothetical protein